MATSHLYGTIEDHADTLEDLILKRYWLIEKIKDDGRIDKYGNDRRVRILNLTRKIYFMRRWLKSKFKKSHA